MTPFGVFNTTDSVPRDRPVRPFAALKRLARKLNVEIKFAVPWNPNLRSPKGGEIQEAYDPGSKYLTTPEGRRFREAVLTKRPARRVRLTGTMEVGEEGKPKFFPGKPAVATRCFGHWIIKR